MLCPNPIAFQGFSASATSGIGGNIGFSFFLITIERKLKYQYTAGRVNELNRMIFLFLNISFDATMIFIPGPSQFGLGGYTKAGRVKESCIRKMVLNITDKKSYPTKMLFNAAPVTVGKARRLRQQQTPAEKKLWDYLRNRKFKSLKFRCQHPIDRYIVDFICMEKMLVVEVDGGIHQEAGQREYDNERTKDFKGYGLKVIRFTNEEVLDNVFDVLKKIELFIEQK